MVPSFWQRWFGRKRAAWRESLEAAYAVGDDRRFDEAEQHLERAVAAVPDGERVHVLVGEPDHALEGFAQIAAHAADYGEFETAVRLLERAEALGADTVPLADAWSRLAESAALLSNWEGAREYLDRAVTTHPGRIMPHHLDLPDLREGE